MDDIIQKLVDFDKECVERIEAAKKKKVEAASAHSKQKKNIYDDYLNSQHEQINQHKQNLMEKNSEKALQQQRQFDETMQKLDSLYLENKEKWIEEIFNRCIQ